MSFRCDPPFESSDDISCLGDTRLFDKLHGKSYAARGTVRNRTRRPTRRESEFWFDSNAVRSETTLDASPKAHNVRDVFEAISRVSDAFLAVSSCA
jgi:hypothetical protein